MSITSFTGEQLLQSGNLEAIKKEADLILQNHDVAAAWQASRHIKMQLAALPGDKVQDVLSAYRALTASLKALSLPLLGWDEVKNLISNNLPFLDSKYAPVLGAGLKAWLATQTDADKEVRRAELLKLLPPASPLALSLTALAAPEVKIAPRAAAVVGGELFDKEESQELASHAQKVSAIGGVPLSISAGATVADNILNISQSPEDKATFLRRVNALITSRLRDVRTKTDLREYLSRPFKVGGLGLGAAVLDQAAGLVEDEYEKLHSHTPVLPAAAPKPAMAVEVVEAVLPARVTTPPVVPPKAVPPPVAKKIEPKAAPQIQPVPDAQRVVRPMRQAPSNDKPRVDDIKSAPRTVSAIDELKLLTIEDWRKYGTADEAIKSILQKVQLLSQQSVNDKVQGIKMFRESELFRQYVALGRATLAQGKKLAEALTDKAINPANITEDEFFAVALLNGKLR